MLAVLAASGQARGAQVVDRVIAVVSGTVYLLSDARAALTLGLVDAAGASDPIEAAMRWLIDRHLVLEEASRGDRIDVDPAALGLALERARQRFSSDAEYQRALEGLGLDEDRVRRLVRDTLAARDYAARRFDSALPATDEELRASYAVHAARFVKDGRQLTFEEALPAVAALLQQERHEQAMASWMERLRRRAEIREVYQPRR